MQAILTAVRTAMALFFLTYASWSDYRTREVSNRVWILFAPPAFALTLVELFLYEPSQLPYYGMCFGLTAVFAIILFYSGGFGGADAKALMCLALAIPFYPQRLLSPLLNNLSPISMLSFPITVFSNAVILVIAPVVWIFLRNVYWRWKTGERFFEGNQRNESLGKRLIVLITGYKIPLSVLKEKWHVYPLEDVEEMDHGGLRRRLIALPKDEGRKDVVGRLENALESGTIKNQVWASPGLPMLILITLGLIVALFLGDIVWGFIETLLR